MTGTEVENNPNPRPDPRPDPDPYSQLDGKSRLDTLSWYLVVIGFMSIAAAGLFLFLREVRYQDYVLNGVALGRYLLVIGGASYVAGRVLSYYRRFRKQKAGARD